MFVIVKHSSLFRWKRKTRFNALIPGMLQPGNAY
jgi:hypothetical protein